MITDPNVEFSNKIKEYSGQGNKYGDWIPDVIKKILRNGKTLDVTACIVFSKICYWFLPRRNGNKKFRGSQLRLSITDLSRQTLLSYSQTKIALQNLENKYKYISRTNVGKYTYVNLNTEIINKAIVLYEPNFADETALTGNILPIHIHKESEKVLPRNKGVKDSIDVLSVKIEHLASKISNVEDLVDDKNNQIGNHYVDRATFDSVCNNTARSMTVKLEHGTAMSELLDYYIYDMGSNWVHTAYSKLMYMHCQSLLTDALDSIGFQTLLSFVKLECENVPQIYHYLSECLCDEAGDAVIKVMQFDVVNAEAAVEKKVNKLREERQELATLLSSYTSELKQLKIET